MIAIISKLIKFNTIAVLGIFRTDDGDMYNILRVKKISNKLKIVSTVAYKSIEEVLADVGNTPVVLLIDGKGVLNKKIDENNEVDSNWKKNIDFSTIHYTNYKSSTHTFLSFCRKNTIEEIISDLLSKGLQIIDFYLGPTLSVQLYPLIKQDKVVSNDSVLEFENGILINVSKQKEMSLDNNYVFDDVILSRHSLSLYGAAIHFFLKHKQITKSSSDSINREEVIYQKSFNYFGVSMLALFFIALLSSYLLIQYYSSENVKLNQKNVYSNQTYQHILNLENQKDQKLKILNETGQLSKYFLSYYVYELSKSVPESIGINELNIFPLLQEVKNKEKVVLNTNFIFLKGSTLDETNFNSWLFKLKKLSWIKKFEIISLSKDKKDIQQFEIKILLNDF